MKRKIIELGQECYWNGNVVQYFAKEDNEYTATVSIQENYSVTLKLDTQGKIVWGECDCSCTDRPYCKHVQAVFCAVRGAS
ncbi:SWIM zinc finger family protein [Sporomusa sp.]|uniref:SWIM zinc finger family protein n=1 Tax=Sporomusa sp. TaxID=2078658 RepID=UPI002CCE01AC|nr:SWIM zinc finger family protein [Sporomusa sp.]HWR06670.1 SWIM zinc finger family protein [Sporomusa sp.]